MRIPFGIAGTKALARDRSVWRRFFLTAVALFACYHAGAQEVLFNTFGAGESFNSYGGPVVGDGVAWFLSGNNGAICAAAFTPVATIPFFRADFAMIYGYTTDLDRTGLPNLDISLTADANGFPGKPLETFHLTNVLEGTLAPGMFSLNSVLHPVLQRGNQYWFVVSTPDLLHTNFSWELGQPGAANRFATWQFLSEVTSLTGWGPVGFPLGNGPAIEVLGGTGAPTPIPVIAENGIVSAASFGVIGGLSPGSWVSVFGSNLSNTTRGWQMSDFGADGSLPTSLDGVSVLLNGKAAAISYVSSNQLNFQVPDPDIYQFPFALQVVTPGGPSLPVSVTLAVTNPALFTISEGGVNYAAATFTDGTLVSPTRPARPGDAVELYGTGFGPSNPPILAGQIVRVPEPLADVSLYVTVGGLAAQVLYAGITEAGLDQINIVVPQVAPGNQGLSIVLTGLGVQGGIVLPVGVL
jgi:uncharacterized protein (TIGR03437 family)